MSLEDTQQLIDSAAVFAAGDTLGRTRDQTLETLRRQQRERRRNRNNSSADAEAFLAENDEQYNLTRDSGSVFDDEAFAFGEDPYYDANPDRDERRTLARSLNF